MFNPGGPMNTPTISALPNDQAVTELLNRGFTSVQLPITQLIQDAIPGFLDTLVDRREGPKCFDLGYIPKVEGFTFPPQKDPDQGLIRKGGKQNPDGTWEDTKRFFHYRPGLLPQLIAHNPEYLVRHSKFIMMCNLIWERAKAQAVAMGHELDKMIPGLQFARNLSIGQNHVLRFLAYEEIRGEKHAADGKKILGQHHLDRSFLTMQLFESHPGFMGYPTNAEFLDQGFPLSSSWNNPALFVGGSAQELTGGVLNAMPHRILDLYGSPDMVPDFAHSQRARQLGLKVYRFSVIFFIQYADYMMKGSTHNILRAR